VYLPSVMRDLLAQSCPAALVGPWVSVDEIAAYLGVRKDPVYRWIQNRGRPAQKVGKLWKFKVSEVDGWMREGGRRRCHATADASLQHETPATVLVVDDDEVLRAALADFLADRGYRALLAGDGEEALALLRTASIAKPSLIVVDLLMPGMDGWRFRAAQADDPALRDIPVLPISAERRFVLPVAGADLLGKPLDLGLFNAAVSRMTGRTQ
jgi:excisionase family DNA binding protein